MHMYRWGKLERYLTDLWNLHDHKKHKKLKWASPGFSFQTHINFLSKSSGLWSVSSLVSQKWGSCSLSPSSCFRTSVCYLHSLLLFTDTQSFVLFPFLEDFDSVVNTRNKITNKIASVFWKCEFFIMLIQSQKSNCKQRCLGQFYLWDTALNKTHIH